MKTINYIGIYLIFSLILFAVAPLVMLYSDIEQEMVRLLIYFGCSGGIGGTIYCVKGFYKHLGEERFKPSWTWWYIFRPIISVMIGIFTYFLIVGGLISISDCPDVNVEKNVMLYCAISFIAGFSFANFTSKVEDLSSTFLAGKKKEE